MYVHDLKCRFLCSIPLPCSASPRSMLQPVFPEEVHPERAPLPILEAPYLLGNVLLSLRDPPGAGGGQPRAQLLQPGLPLCLSVHGVSVEDGRWRLGAAQRRHFNTARNRVENNRGKTQGYVPILTALDHTPYRSIQWLGTVTRTLSSKGVGNLERDLTETRQEGETDSRNVKKRKNVQE